MLDIAKLFTDKARKDILTEDLINKAQPTHSSNEMKLLMLYWVQFVEPQVKADCGVCFERVLNNYRQLQNFLIKLEQDSRLLDG